MDCKGLKKWFEAEQRDLPWRRDRSPYAVWVSEMMLQQTQVSVVIPYFERWMERFPTINALAEASLDEVIKLWEGLGYYSRARYLHAGAQFIASEHKGVFPRELSELKKIKGLGEYTTGAIRSFAFHEKTTAVDGNVIRVLARYYAIQDDSAKPQTVGKLRQIVADFLPEEAHWVINEALIELGATVCTRTPKCGQCPLRKTCSGYAQGIASELPFKSKKTKTENLYRAVAIIEHQNKFLVRRSQQGEIMSDLHEFPYFEVGVEGVSEKQLTYMIKGKFQIKATWETDLPEESHSFTRYRVKLFPAKFSCKSPPHIDQHQWLTLTQLRELAFSSGHRRILQML